jgi:hypothetical protein
LLNLETSTGNKVTILNSGNVGIGTTGPGYALDVNHTTAAGTLGYALRLRNNTVDNTDITGLGFSVYGAATVKSGIIYKGLTSGWYRGDIQFLQNSAGDGTNASLTDVVMTIANTGNVGIGITAPTAYLHLKAGTATANTAPIKIDAGVVNTTPVTGCIESDGTHLYWTDSGGTRRQLDNV